MSLSKVSEIQLDKDKKKILKEFREDLEDILQPRHDDRFLLRWLRARDFDLKKAERMIRESFKFRKKIGADDILTSYELPEVFRKYVCTKFLGYDKEGSIVRSAFGGIYDYKGVVRSMHVADIMKCVVYLLEFDFQKSEEYKMKNGRGQEKSTYIFDLDKFNLNQFYDKAVINAGILLINMYQNNYPELLKCFYIINVPPYFTWVFNIFKPFINEVTLNKIKICRGQNWKMDLLDVIDPNILPDFLGGELVDPDGDPKYFMDPKIPTSYYFKDHFCLKADDPSAKLITIRERSHFDHKLNISKPGTIIRWEFQTKDNNLRFGVFFKDDKDVAPKNSSTTEELIPVQDLDCHILPEKGELLCEKDGNYILHFDNTHSWLTSKQLLYKVEQKEPMAAILEEN